MRKESVKKIAVFDQGHPVFYQLMTKARELFDGDDTEFIRISCEDPNPMIVTDRVEAIVRHFFRTPFSVFDDKDSCLFCFLNYI